MARVLYLAILAFAAAYIIQYYRVKRCSITRETADNEYDFVIVGAGTSGSVIANRLSEIHNVKILLLEAGEEDSPNFLINTPMMVTTLQNASTDWSYRTVPQKHSCFSLKDQVSFWPRGKVLGGSSSINYMVYSRGNRYDYDAWEASGAVGWGFDDVLAYFKKAESGNIKGHNNLGTDGPLNIESSFGNKASKWFIKAGKEIGYKEFDYNAGTGEGFSRIQYSRKNGVRQSSSSGYLHQVAKQRSNLHILSGAHVQRILFDQKDEVPRAIGVEYIKNGQKFEVVASKEVILSAGAVGSPHLLMVSGVGPKQNLEDNKIDYVVDLPGVGSNLQDHMILPVGFVSDNDDFSNSVMNWWTLFTPKNIFSYMYDGSGPLGSSSLDVISYLNVLSKEDAGKDFEWPDLHVLFQSMEWNAHSRLHQMMLKTNFNFDETFVKGYSEAATKMGKDHVSTFQLILGLSHPHSTGSIKLQSPDINQHPLIDPHYLEDNRDVKVLLEGFKVLEKLENSKAYKSKGLRMSIVAPNCDSLEIRSEKYYECVARSLALTEYHPCCTAKMGHEDDVMAVTDSRLRVRKVSGLRIADASVMPMVTTANTQSPCYMIGEKAADLIKSDWGLIL